jgi:diguanylate cyclase (GGDEF)-like protein
MRSSDIVSRFGGDEFVLVLYNCTKKDAVSITRRIIEHIEDPMEVQKKELKVGASAGIATFPEDGRELSELIRIADERLLTAKKNGLMIKT